MAIVERSRLKGASAQSPPVDTFFQKDFFMNSLLGNREYLLDQVPAIIAIFDNVKTLDEIADHDYQRNVHLPEWHGWHAARRGLGSNLYRLGVSEKTIQHILRHANASTTASYYIKTAAGDVRTAMIRLENLIAEAAPVQSATIATPNRTFPAEPSSVQ
jgi:hypothetical protein